MNLIERKHRETLQGAQMADGLGKLKGLNLVATHSKQILAVCLLDDDPSVLKSTSRLLDPAGWDVQSLTDPMAFLEHARVHHPRVAVIDILMPAMNGLEVQTRLRSISPSTQVIILTSKDDPSVRETAMTEGACAFFVKGVDNRELLPGIESAGAET